MAGEGEKTTKELLKKMQQQMVSLQTQVNEMHQQQKQQSTAVDHEAVEDKDGLGYLVELLEMTKSFLEAAFSAITAIIYHKMRLDWIGIPDCDAIRCPKLDQVMQSIIPSDGIKAVFIMPPTVLVGHGYFPQGTFRECGGWRVRD